MHSKGLGAEGEGVDPGEEGVEEGCAQDANDEVDREELVPWQRVGSQWRHAAATRNGRRRGGKGGDGSRGRTGWGGI